MARGNDRLVQGIQRRLESVRPMSPALVLPSRCLAELEARIERLHGLGDRFAEVKLSGFVAGGSARALAGHVGDRVLVKED